MIRVFIFLCLLALLVSCSTAPKAVEHVPKFKTGDCFRMGFMVVDFDMVWTSSSNNMGGYKIVDIIQSDKPNAYMAERRHGKTFYVLKYDDGMKMDDLTEWQKQAIMVVPVEDLDGFRYADVYWHYKENNIDEKGNKRCNAYRED